MAQTVRVLRVLNEDSVFLYWIFESYEGLVSYSTLSFLPSEIWRDIEVMIPDGFLSDFEWVMGQLTKSGLSYRIADSRSALPALLPQVSSN